MSLFSKERNILSLNQPHFFNLYQLNINHKRAHTLPYKYIPIEKLKIKNLELPLFVINLGGNHIPSKKQIKIEKKIMKKRFPFQIEYEIMYKKNFIEGFMKIFFLLYNCYKYNIYIEIRI